MRKQQKKSQGQDKTVGARFIVPMGSINRTPTIYGGSNETEINRLAPVKDGVLKTSAAKI
jgi:hypothetical protein